MSTQIYHETPSEQVKSSRNFEVVKGCVTTEEIASRYTHIGPDGRGRCPIHGGSNRTSFALYGDGFYCHSCGAGGDVIRLVALMEQEEDVWAMVRLATEYGIEIGPSPQWKRRQAKQKPARDALGRIKAQVLRRRYFAYCIMPIIKTTTNKADQNDEIKRAWDDFSEISDAAIIAWYEGAQDAS